MSALTALEEEFPSWFAFVRSHFDGKYSSILNAHGTQQSEDRSSNEEAVQGVWAWWLLEGDGGRTKWVKGVEDRSHSIVPLQRDDITIAGQCVYFWLCFLILC